jgi:hypothetical protein
MAPTRPASYTDHECPAWVFDPALAIPAASCRPVPPPKEGPAPRPGKADEPTPTLFREPVR